MRGERLGAGRERNQEIWRKEGVIKAPALLLWSTGGARMSRGLRTSEGSGARSRVMVSSAWAVEPVVGDPACPGG